jgi:glycosyltransferase involved in cell wall biosynthesis
MKILIIANARWIPGLSGSDIIYMNFKKYWPADVEVWEMLDIDFKPFWACYIYRIMRGCFRALLCQEKYAFVYSASDFWMDSIPAVILKLKGNKWVAGFYLYAPRCKPIYYFLQKIVYWLILAFADIVCLTNGSMVYGFKDKKTVEVNGGVDLSLAARDRSLTRHYDAVFCGRIHPSKGINELIEIWKLVRKQKPTAKLALIGDYDLGVGYIKQLLGGADLGITLFGYMDEARFNIYKQSKVVLYPAKWDHFSMSPVEAMACGCPMVAFDLPVMKYIKPKGVMLAKDIEEYVDFVMLLLNDRDARYALMQSAIAWANTWDWRITTKKVYDQILKGVA